MLEKGKEPLNLANHEYTSMDYFSSLLITNTICLNTLVWQSNLASFLREYLREAISTKEVEMKLIANLEFLEAYRIGSIFEVTFEMHNFDSFKPEKIKGVRKRVVLFCKFITFSLHPFLLKMHKRSLTKLSCNTSVAVHDTCLLHPWHLGHVLDIWLLEMIDFDMNQGDRI